MGKQCQDDTYSLVDFYFVYFLRFLQRRIFVQGTWNSTINVLNNLCQQTYATHKRHSRNLFQEIELLLFAASIGNSQRIFKLEEGGKMLSIKTWKNVKIAL